MKERRPLPWPVQWVRSEFFWQGVAIQTVGTLIAALFAAMVAILTGVGNYTAALRYYVVSALIVILLVGVGGLIGATTIFTVGREPHSVRRTLRLLGIAVLVFSIGLVSGFFNDEILDAIARWTGYERS